MERVDACVEQNTGSRAEESRTGIPLDILAEQHQSSCSSIPSYHHYQHIHGQSLTKLIVHSSFCLGRRSRTLDLPTLYLRWKQIVKILTYFLQSCVHVKWSVFLYYKIIRTVWKDVCLHEHDPIGRATLSAIFCPACSNLYIKLYITFNQEHHRKAILYSHPIESKVSIIDAEWHQ